MIRDVASQFMDICIDEMQEEGRKKKVREEVLDPLIEYIGEKLWPYIITTVLVILSMLLLLSYTTFKVIRLS